MRRGRFLYQRLEEVAEGRRKVGFGLVGLAKGLVGVWYSFGPVWSGLSGVFVGTFLSVFHDPRILWSNTSFYYFFFTLHILGVWLIRERTLLAMDVMSWWGFRSILVLQTLERKPFICNSFLLNLFFLSFSPFRSLLPDLIVSSRYFYVSHV